MFLHVVDAKHIEGHRVALRFSDGTTGEADLSGSRDGPIFQPLRDVTYFRQFSIEDHTLGWPNALISHRSICTNWSRRRLFRDRGMMHP